MTPPDHAPPHRDPRVLARRRAASPGRRGALGAAAVLVLLLAACGGGGGGPTDGVADSGSGTGSGEAGTTDPATTDGPTGPIELGRLQAATGDAPAAGGARLEVPPGARARTPLLGFAETAAAVTTPDGTVVGWCLLLALTPGQRSRGLMEVTDLGGYAGMLFVWPHDSSSSFYMRNTPTPLTIGWFDAEGDLVSTADMAPCEDVDGCPLYSADGSYRFAVEVPQGDLARAGVVDGSRLAVGGDCA